MRRGAWIAGGLVAALAGLVLAASALLDEPLRQRIEAEMNRRLDGYTVRIGRLDFHPVGFSIDFHDLVLTQDAHPDPPMARFPRISASVHWRELLRAALVADFILDRPVLHLDLARLRAEARDARPVAERGWQDAVRAMYPLKINELRVRAGELSYVDRASARPLRLHAVDGLATNIRNTASRERVYPSELRLGARVFERGRLTLDGSADFLAEPHPGVLAKVELADVELGYFRPVLERWNVALRGGVLTAAGDLEYAPWLKAVHLEHATVRGVSVDYIRTPRARAEQTEAKAAGAAAEAAEQAANRPDLQVRIGRLRVVEGTFGFVNRAARPGYRVFLSATDLTLENLSNHVAEGTARLRLKGRFMGSGATVVTGTFRAERDGPDFDLAVAVVDTEMRAMNDLLRAHGKLDVVAGVFSVYSELAVKNRAVRGYVKPLFRGLDVYDPAQEEREGLLQKLYEGALGLFFRLLENRPREEVATVTRLSGPLENPRASTWEVIANLVRNAFFDAILPGFQREVRPAGR